MKTCTRCGVEKPFSDFSPHKLGKGGVRSICKPCSVKAVQEYRQTDKGREVSRKATRKRKATPEGNAYHREYERKRRLADPVPYLLRRCKSRAEAKGVPFALTVADVTVPDVCPVLGIPIRSGSQPWRAKCFGGESDAISIDRIDPAKGYVPGNIAVISWRANRLKNDATLEELEALVRWMRSIRR